MLGEVCGCVDNLVQSFELEILSFIFDVGCQGSIYSKIGGKKRTIYKGIKLT